MEAGERVIGADRPLQPPLPVALGLRDGHRVLDAAGRYVEDLKNCVEIVVAKGSNSQAFRLKRWNGHLLPPDGKPRQR